MIGHWVMDCIGEDPQILEIRTYTALGDYSNRRCKFITHVLQTPARSFVVGVRQAVKIDTQKRIGWIWTTP